MNYEKDCKIDCGALDVEWLGQAQLAMKWGKHYAECKKELSQAEETLKVTRSELVKEVNENPEKCCNKSKPNTADIEAYYRNHKDHKEYKKKVIELQYKLDVAEIAKNEISFTRKASLEALVTLHGQQYFAGPKVPRNLSQEWEQHQRQEQANSVVASKMVRRRK